MKRRIDGKGVFRKDSLLQEAFRRHDARYGTILAYAVFMGTSDDDLDSDSVVLGVNVTPSVYSLQPYDIDNVLLIDVFPVQENDLITLPTNDSAHRLSADAQVVRRMHRHACIHIYLLDSIFYNGILRNMRSCLLTEEGILGNVYH